LITENTNKTSKTLKKTKTYKNTGSQTNTPPEVSGAEASHVHDQIIMRDITFMNCKTGEEETRHMVKGTYAAWLGDTRHRLDCQLAIGYLNDKELQGYVSAKSQAQFLKQYYPELTPPPHPNGTPASDHTVATVFEILYFTKKGFAEFYLNTQFTTPDA